MSTCCSAAGWTTARCAGSCSTRSGRGVPVATFAGCGIRVTDRSVREDRIQANDRAVLLLDGPFLRAGGLPLDAVVHVQVSRSTLARSLPPDRQWWLEAFERYVTEDHPVENAAVVVAYDHPAAPAVSWAVRPG